MKNNLLSLIKSDFKTHGSNPWSPGFRALAVQRLGHWRLNQKHPVKGLLKPVVRALEYKVRTDHGIELHDSTEIGTGVRIDHGYGLVVHGNAVIGNNVLLRQGVTIGAKGDAEHHRHKAPKIGNNVSIGAGAVVVGDIAICDGAKIKANSVVSEDVGISRIYGLPGYATATASYATGFGVPTRAKEYTYEE